MKATSLFVSSLLLAIVLGMGSGCARKPDDAKISSDVQGKFSQDSGLASKQLTVQANGGVVTLEGTVDNAAQREAASRQAASVPGVKTVVNNLQVPRTRRQHHQCSRLQRTTRLPRRLRLHRRQRS
jgi:predicted kinase